MTIILFELYSFNLLVCVVLKGVSSVLSLVWHWAVGTDTWGECFTHVLCRRIEKRCDLLTATNMKHDDYEKTRNITWLSKLHWLLHWTLTIMIKTWENLWLELSSPTTWKPRSRKPFFLPCLKFFHLYYQCYKTVSKWSQLGPVWILSTPLQPLNFPKESIFTILILGSIQRAII